MGWWLWAAHRLDLTGQRRFWITWWSEVLDQQSPTSQGFLLKTFILLAYLESTDSRLSPSWRISEDKKVELKKDSPPDPLGLPVVDYVRRFNKVT